MPHPAYIPIRKVPNAPGKYYNNEGYVLVWVKQGEFKLEHRVLAEKALKRKLKTHETVHHINGIRSDNRPENLLVCTAKYHHNLHRRCYDTYNSWHLPGQANPKRESMRRLRRGKALNTANPVARMKPPYERSDTVSSNSTGSRQSVSLPSVASILSEPGWK